MAMLSLKRFLNVNEEESTLRKVVYLLLEKIGSAAVEGDREAHKEFRMEMEEIRDRASLEIAPESFFVTAGSAVQAMENYNRQITMFLKKQGDQLQSIVTMITETVVTIGGDNTRAAQRLLAIGDKFERGAALGDLQALKSHLSDCLHTFREEAQRQKAESDTAIQSLQQEIVRRQSSDEATLQNLDVVTGLPRQAAGVLAMQEAARNGKRLYVLALVVSRIQSVNARFGSEVGDRIIRLFKENLEKQLPRSDRLFRWDGPAIIVLLDREESIEVVRAQMRRILDARLEESFEVDGRSVLIPISAAWSAFPLMPPLAGAVKQIQAFIASQGGRD